MDENSCSLYSEHHHDDDYTMMMPLNYSLSPSPAIFNNMPCEDDAQKPSLGFMELLGGVPEFASLFDSSSAHCFHYNDLSNNNNNNNNSLQAASPNSNSSISSSSIEAPTIIDEQAKRAITTTHGDHVEVEDLHHENDEDIIKKQLLKPKKKNQKKQREARIAFMTKSEVDHLEDGYRWRKYGQKAVKNSPYPRSYYRCTNATCGVKKRVERSCTDPSVVVTTYEGQHTHPSPMMPRGGFAAAAAGVSHPLLSSTTSYGSGIASLIQMNISTHNVQQQPFFHHNMPLVVPHHLISLGSSVLRPLQGYSNILGHDQGSFCHSTSTFQGDHGLLQDVLPFDHMIRKED
ncbi:hypothetical protein Scep_008844 [Stephania cephalantha]|uniref:WRKY domain-containing protein n=1 Tax=Stephania cephalantha TaxID=152367 RepID=A0AAP0PC03_9MAGN